MPREPFVRVDTLAPVPNDGTEERFAVTTRALYHLHCAPWGDPEYRIARPGV